VKKKDIIVIVVLCVIIGIGYVIFQMLQGEKDLIAVHYQDQVIQTIDISVNETYEFDGSYGKFYLEVKDGKYHATHVDCPNHDCEKVGWVEKGSTTPITCVPNEIYVVQIGMEEAY